MASEGGAEAISFNSVPWELVYPPHERNFGQRSPLWRLERKIGGGGGGISGRLAQPFNWKALAEIKSQVPQMPVIGSSAVTREDVVRLRRWQPDAISFGAMFLRTPWRPTMIIRREQRK